MSDLGQRVTAWTDLDWSHMPGWALWPVVVNGEAVATMAQRGTEIHFVIDPAWRRRLLTRKLIRTFLAPHMERYGFLTTRVMPTDFRARVFVERLGFLRTWHDGTLDHYMLTALPYSREK